MTLEYPDGWNVMTNKCSLSLVAVRARSSHSSGGLSCMCPGPKIWPVYSSVSIREADDLVEISRKKHCIVIISKMHVDLCPALHFFFFCHCYLCYLGLIIKTKDISCIFMVICLIPFARFTLFSLPFHFLRIYFFQLCYDNRQGSIDLSIYLFVI